MRVQGGTHLGSMIEEQSVRLRARDLSQKLCSVKANKKWKKKTF